MDSVINNIGLGGFLVTAAWAFRELLGIVFNHFRFVGGVFAATALMGLFTIALLVASAGLYEIGVLFHHLLGPI